MEFGFTADQTRFRTRVRCRFADDRVRDALRRVRAQGVREPDTRPLYRVLGDLGLLAVGWPAEYGGGGRDPIETAIAIEELVRAGIPDTMHVNTIQIVGLFLLLAGTEEQKRAHLPAMARGEKFASVLYTEPESGSDLGSLRTTATPDGDGWRLHGEKVFSLKSDVTDLGLCAARTGPGTYDGISLFLVDLHADGVRVEPIASIADEDFHRIRLDGVRVGAGDLLGETGGGWPLLTRALAVERTGLDYTLKAERWLRAVRDGMPDPDDLFLAGLGRNAARLEASRLLSWRVLTGGPDVDEVAAAVAKLYSSELAQEVAGWAAEVYGFGYGRAWLDNERVDLLEAAYREAPGLTLSAGTSEVMLQIIGSVGLDAYLPAGKSDGGKR
ncbi:acyl-CoA dehydrogenase family protein [Paractinoplanes ferrugineus]|uniref:Acyl-CoA dehydrogenase n=1 Tax=Paractinoplanes ferrugineus TaxID=113564 RepID=A0A919MMJ8_9ACTN|nr:acyl-CoA dehydrogenase family protein [Actinoplanes ferrugineus]GIE13337.1 putative acyl-CoA dehydrogenase [Actinoplanes ferrugineus]